MSGEIDPPRVLAGPKERAAAMEENLIALFRSMSIVDGYGRFEREGLFAHHAWPTNPMFQGVWGNRLPAHSANRIIDETLAWFDSRRAPFQFWWFNEDVAPADLGARLLVRGFELNFDGDPAMVADLDDLPEMQLPEGCTVEIATDRDALEAWRDVFTGAYDLPASLAQAWVDVAHAVGAERTPWQLYLARQDGVPLGTSMLYCGGGVAGLFAVGTLPAARGRGIGTALTLGPMGDARRRGYHHGALFASPMGKRVYQRLGFQDTGRRIIRYMRTVR